jgi:hypothetical protein
VVVVASGREANVHYQLGLCHGLRRWPIVLVRSGEELPFGRDWLGLIRYEEGEDGMRELARELGDFVQGWLKLVRSRANAE